MLFEDYKCSVGVVYSGGCASNACRRTINSRTPDRYPDYKHFCANTDAKVLNFHFGDPEEPQQKMWVDAQAFFPHQLGGDKITRGRGAGADPEVARRAVRTKHSTKALREFYNGIGDGELVFTQGLGKGTGSGAGPEAIMLAVKMKKSAIAICVMPEQSWLVEPGSGRL